MKVTCLSATPLLVLALLVAAPTWAQEAPQDESSDELARIGMEASPGLRRAKRRQAKREKWALTGVATGAVGYDSNIFLGPQNETDSATFDIGAKLDGLIYLTRRDRLKASFETTNLPYSASSKVSDFTQKGALGYYHRFRGVGSLSLTGDVKHSNDSATNVLGQSFTRDFENVSYRAQTGFRWKIADDHTLTIGYGFKVKDYTETSGLTSLDWWRHGPKLQYAFQVSDPLRLKLGYEFRQQLYRQEEAGNSNGIEPGTNPSEDHFFHTVRASAEWQVSPMLSFEGGFRYRNKDDRFADFESYDDFRGDLSLALVPMKPLRLEATVRVSHRDYDNRRQNVLVPPGTGTLEYDRYGVDLSARYELSEHLAIWVIYGFDKRDTNRVGGISYLDYEQHTSSVGITAAF